MTGDKQRVISQTGHTNKTAKAGEGRRATLRDGGVEDSEGSEGNMRRKRRLETFQPVFPALLIKM